VDDNNGAKFQVDPVPESNYLEIKLSGFFSEKDMIAFVKALETARLELDPDISKRRSFYDVSEFRVQSQDIVTHFGALVNDRKNLSSRIAVYVGDAAVKMQASRLILDNARIFEDEEEARAWLWS
jgi:SpoIIAA-like